MASYNPDKRNVGVEADEKSVDVRGFQTKDEVHLEAVEQRFDHSPASAEMSLEGRLRRWNDKVESLSGFEGRGIAQVLNEDKHDGGLHRYIQMWLLWFSINLVASNIITGLLGPLVFSLGWKDSVFIVVFGTALAVVGPSYLATFGPESGHRTMIIGRFFFGYWPSKIICVLNLIQQIGWGIIGCILSGQMLSAVNGHGLTIAVGCAISALCIGLVAAFGIRLVFRFERYAFFPQLIALMVLIGSAGREFDVHSISTGSSGAITANRCTFFVLIVSSLVGFSATGADYYSYYPANTPKWITFTTTWSAMWIASMFCNLVGVGVASGIANNPSWSEAYSISSGALLLKGYDGLGAFGGFCTVILALGSITNNAPCSYSAALTIQALGQYTKIIPRWIWVLVITIIELVCSVAGRNHLFTIFENFLPIMSYWLCPWVIIIAEEHLFFFKLRHRKPEWSASEDVRVLPVGLAAMFSFLCGWAGAVIGMYQVWWQGPLGLRVGGYGGDIGTWLSIGFAGVVFPPLRYAELKFVGR